MSESLDSEQRSSFSPEEAYRRLSDGWPVQVLDVRSLEERDGGWIAGDRSIPLGELSERMNEVQQDAAVLVYCQSGNRSAFAAQALLAGGYEAYNLTGGIAAWRAAGLPIKTST